MVYGYIVKSKFCVISLFLFLGIYMIYCIIDYVYGIIEIYLIIGGQYFVIVFIGYFYIYR